MMNADMHPIVKELVFIGGGHSHAIALRMLGMKPLPGVRLTLITNVVDTPYSGMLPGHIAGFYTYDECHIDLRLLCQFAKTQLYLDHAVGLDLQTNQVICANRPPVKFDLLSIDIGSTPKLPAGVDVADGIIAAKPVDRFLQNWQKIIDQVSQKPQQPIAIGIVGGGAGGVELALTIQHRLQSILQAANQPPENLTIHLWQREATLLPKHSRWVSQYFCQLLTQRGICLHLQEPIVRVDRNHVYSQSGQIVSVDHVIWVTQAGAPDWLKQAGLTVDDDGFVLVDDTLRSLSHPQIFATGDVATMINHPRPKAGVFAVRQGKPLAQNLRRVLQNQLPKPFYPQKQYLSLIGTGDGAAVASRGMSGWHSRWLWQWKDRIDRAFMQRFRQLPPMSGEAEGVRTEDATTSSVMRCAGCGAKVGSPILERVVERIQPSRSPSAKTDILVGLNAPDDAAVIQVPPDKVLVQTLDYFPALINDPFILGQISTHHALSDLFAMGAQPHSALAIATLPFAGSASMEETLYQVLAGAIQVLQAANAELIGGHTTEGADLVFGLACNGFADPQQLLRKGGVQPGQVLILTKAIGTGALFAAQMRLQAKGRWIDGAITAMLQSNQQAATCLLQHGATACTDVTGFGLVGHLVEMLRASSPVAVNLELEAIPWLEGALTVTQQGIVSSLYRQNVQATQLIANAAAVDPAPPFPLLFDPQTSGGLLAAVPAAMGDRCVTALKQLGYHNSTIIGHTFQLAPGEKPITVKS